ncbi:MAG: hypothetical protein R3213_09740 [Flavobacteriaceae bacterium]|nr:hypothetical protein [Flavobacteriaceae bacterium]
MKFEKIIEAERKEIDRYDKIYLPHRFKMIGIGILLLGLVTLISFKFIEGEPFLLRDFIKKLIIVGLLVYAISKDKVEDEYTVQLRGKAFSIAFIFGVTYALVQPYITYGMAALLGKEDKLDLLELGDFQLIFFMLLVQIGFYWLLKRTR